MAVNYLKPQFCHFRVLFVIRVPSEEPKQLVFDILHLIVMRYNSRNPIKELCSACSFNNCDSPAAQTSMKNNPL